MATNPHIYVSSVHGTNTGASDTSQATQQTGNITSMTASDVYTTLEAAVLGCTPTHGDNIYVCDNHSATYAMAASINLNSVNTLGTGVSVLSVDNTAIDEQKAGATEVQTNKDRQYIIWGTGRMFGMSLTTGIPLTPGISWVIEDCTLYTLDNNTPVVNMVGDGKYVKFINCNFDTAYGTAVGAVFKQITKGGTVEVYGGSVTNSKYSSLVITHGQEGGTLKCVGLDMTNLSSIYSSAADLDPNTVILQNCKLPASVTLPTAGTTLLDQGNVFSMTGCDDGTNDLIHRFAYITGSGSAVNNDSTYVTANQPWYEGSAKSSIKVTTSSICSRIRPFAFEMPAKYVDLSSASSDKVSINIVTDFTLYDTDISFTLYYSDGTTAVQTNSITTRVDPLKTPAELNTTGALTAGDWTGEPTSPNFYKVDLDTSTDAGQASVVIIQCEVYKASILGTTNTYLYIDPILTVGT